jgi:hypothetical protein
MGGIFSPRRFQRACGSFGVAAVPATDVRRRRRRRRRTSGSAWGKVPSLRLGFVYFLLGRCVLRIL